MIAYLKNNCSLQQKQELQQSLTSHGYNNVFVPKLNLIVIPNLKSSAILEKYTQIDRVTEINTAYQLSSILHKPETTFTVNGEIIGKNNFNIVAGPCSVENEDQLFLIGEFLQKHNIKFLRGGAFKPRTSPYDFRGLGIEGLKLLRKVADTYNMTVVTELMDIKLLDSVYQYADIIQIGSRNMSNFYLLNEIGKQDKPVLLKRGMQAKIDEWLLAADYILTGGNEKVILCERGIRSFDSNSRNVMDIAAIPLLKSLSHLPVWADPSHGTGNAKLVPALAKASTVVGANGLFIEIHPNPKTALSDVEQALTFDEFSKLLPEIEMLNNLKPASLEFSN